MVSSSADSNGSPRGVRLFGLQALVRKCEPKLKSGIVLPDSARDSGDTANVCEVLVVGDGRFVGREGHWMQVETRLKPGMLVVVDPKFAVPVRLDGKVYGIIEEEHVLLVLDREMEVV